MSKMELVKLLAHLVVTLVLVLSYVLLAFVKGEHDATLQNLLILAVGYWFGAVTLGKSNDTKQ
jgi:hypothetical protein